MYFSSSFWIHLLVYGLTRTIECVFPNYSRVQIRYVTIVSPHVVSTCILMLHSLKIHISLHRPFQLPSTDPSLTDGPSD